MKKHIFGALALGCLLALMIAAPARAQAPGTTMRASIPFDFIVRGRTLPAGYYEIRRINDEPTGLVIQNINHRRAEAMFETEPVYSSKEPNRSLVVFHRYGDSYFLSAVVTAGSETGEELTTSHAEKRLRRELASNNAEPETVTLALN